MADIGDETQRALGRIEGMLGGLNDKLDNLDVKLASHLTEDTANFSQTRRLIYEHRGEIRLQFEEAARARNQHLNEQDVKLDALKQDADRAKGAGWVILGLLSALAASLGAAVIAALSGWLTLRT